MNKTHYEIYEEGAKHLGVAYPSNKLTVNWKSAWPTIEVAEKAKQIYLKYICRGELNGELIIYEVKCVYKAKINEYNDR